MQYASLKELKTAQFVTDIVLQAQKTARVMKDRLSRIKANGSDDGENSNNLQPDDANLKLLSQDSTFDKPDEAKNPHRLAYFLEKKKTVYMNTLLNQLTDVVTKLKR